MAMQARLSRQLDALRESRAERTDRLAALRRDRDERAEIREAIQEAARFRPSPLPAADLAARLAQTLDGEVVRAGAGIVVRVERPALSLPVDRDRLAFLPGMPDPATPLLCLDTETTGLGTATGTAAFIVGLGWWDALAAGFRQVQLVLPDMSEEAALLAALRDAMPPGAALVTYNGRTFDWPLLVTRFRMGLAVPPAVAQHLDLLLVVRRLFRHRLPDARLQTVEAAILGTPREPDVPAWEIPALYQDFLRGGYAPPLESVAEHNREDVATLGRLLGHVAATFGAREAWEAAPSGDLVGLARLLAAAGRPDEAVECLELARAGAATLEAEIAAAFTLARLQRKLGRYGDAATIWRSLAGSPGSQAALAWIELAKHHEHRERNLPAALHATDAAIATYRPAVWGAVTRSELTLVHDLSARRARLTNRLARLPASDTRGARGPGDGRSGQPRQTRRSTAAPSGTPSRPTPSTAHDPAAAARRSERRPAGSSPASQPAIRAARNTSPAPVGSTTSARSAE